MSGAPYLLLGAVGFVLLIARECGEPATLAPSPAKEIAVHRWGQRECVSSGSC